MRVSVIFLLLSLGAVGLGVAQSRDAANEQALAHQQRAHQLLNEKKPELAVKEFAAVLVTDPNNLDAQGNLGVLLYFQRQYTQAVEHLRKAVELDPSLFKIQALLGLCEYRLGLDSARANLASAVANLKDLKTRKEAGLTLIEIYTAQGALADAASVIEKLRQDSPADPEILYAAYRINSDLAGEALLSLSLAAPQSGQMQQAIAHELERVRDLRGAAEGFRKAIAADPNLPGIHFEYAEALRASDNQNDRAQAEHEYAIALEKNPREVQAAVRLGDINADRNDLDHAAGFYQQALALQPNNADAMIGLARVYSDKDDNEKALSLLQRTLEADPTNILAHFRLSALYRKMRRPDDAKRELAEYQKYKDIKDNMRKVYSAMRLRAPGSAGEDPDVTPAANEAVH
jgi:Tfp pilus assembly protein PilF